MSLAHVLPEAMPSSRRTHCRRAAGLLLLGSGCGGRSSTASRVETATTAATDRTDGRTQTATGATDGAGETTSLVFHDVDLDGLPRPARVGVLSPEVWEWVTTAAETGAADVGVADDWTPTFPAEGSAPTSDPDPTARRAPRVDLAIAGADVLLVGGQPYAVRTTYRAAEASYRLKTRRVGSIEEAEPPEATDTVANVSALPPDQRRIARTAVEAEHGYHVGLHESRSEAFEAVSAYDYLRHEGETYWTFVVHGDNFLVHTTLWAEQVEEVGDAGVVVKVEPVTLSDRGREVVGTAIESTAVTVETVPESLADAVATYDALTTTTTLYRARLR
jgi:hypothetical protein